MECGRNNTLRSNYSRTDSNNKRRYQPPWGYAVEEWISVGLWTLGNERRLADVGDEETWVYKSNPADLNCLSTESSNTGEENFHTGEAQEDATKTAPPAVSVAYEIVECVVWVEGLQHAMI